MSRQNILMIGANDIIGDSLYQNLISDEFNANAIKLVPKPNFNNNQDDSWEILDVKDFHELTIKIMDFNPDVVIYNSFMKDKPKCQRNPDLAYLVNTEVVEHIKEIISILNCHFIFISNDLVHTVNNESNDNKTDRNEINSLAGSMYQGEAIVSKYGKSTIVRPGFLYSGTPIPQSYCYWLTSRANSNTPQQFPIYDIQPIEIKIFDQLIFILMKQRKYGQFNLCSDEIVSSQIFTEYLCEKLSLDCSNIEWSNTYNENLYLRKYYVMDNSNLKETLSLSSISPTELH